MPVQLSDIGSRVGRSAVEHFVILCESVKAAIIDNVNWSTIFLHYFGLESAWWQDFSASEREVLAGSPEYARIHRALTDLRRKQTTCDDGDQLTIITVRVPKKIREYLNKQSQLKYRTSLNTVCIEQLLRYLPLEAAAVDPKKKI